MICCLDKILSHRYIYDSINKKFKIKSIQFDLIEQKKNLFA